MRIGINYTMPHETPEQWAKMLSEKGYRASSFPVSFREKVSRIDAYVKAAKDYDIRIAEVGVWNSPHHADAAIAQKSKEICLEQLKLAEYIGADCCVNVSGAAGETWYGCYAENYTQAMYEKNVELIRWLIDTVKPVKTSFALEPMQWMIPWSAEQYRKLIDDVDREAFKVHMDICNFVYSPYLFTHQKEMMEDTFRLLSNHIVSCHLKDIRMRNVTSVMIEEVPVGTGNLEIGEYLKHISDLHKDMPLLIEHLDKPEQYDAALAYVKNHYSTFFED